MDTAAQDEQSKKIQATLDRSRALLAEADELRQRHDQLRTQFPENVEAGAALAWLQDNARTNPKAAQALEEFENWKRSRPDPEATQGITPKATNVSRGRRNWQAI